jgi:hypothetical protein
MARSPWRDQEAAVEAILSSVKAAVPACGWELSPLTPALIGE